MSENNITISFVYIYSTFCFSKVFAVLWNLLTSLLWHEAWDEKLGVSLLFYKAEN